MTCQMRSSRRRGLQLATVVSAGLVCTFALGCVTTVTSNMGPVDEPKSPAEVQLSQALAHRNLGLDQLTRGHTGVAIRELKLSERLKSLSLGPDPACCPMGPP